MIPYLFFIALGYVSGSMLYAYLVPKWFRRIDITAQSRDGNPGTANAFLCAGVPVGIAVLMLELAKAFLPVHWATRVLDSTNPLFGLVVAAPVVGHAFPFWRPREGGKAIASSFGALLGLLPEWRPLLLLAFFYLLFSLLVVIRPHFFRSVVTFALFSAGCFLLVKNTAYIFGCIILSTVVVCKHFARYQGERLRVQSLREVLRER